MFYCLPQSYQITSLTHFECLNRLLSGQFRYRLIELVNNPIIASQRMPALLTIHVLSNTNHQVDDIEFVNEGEWNQETENQLIYKLQRLLGLLRPMAETLSLFFGDIRL